MAEEFFEDERSKKYMRSTARTMHFCEPKNDREAELISIAYIGAMGGDNIPKEDILKITVGIRHGYSDLVKLVME